MLFTPNHVQQIARLSDFDKLTLPTSAADPALPVAPPPRPVAAPPPFDPMNPGTGALTELPLDRQTALMHRITLLSPLVERIGPATVIADIDRLRGGGIQRRRDELLVELELDFPGLDLKRLESFRATLGPTPTATLRSAGKEFSTNSLQVVYRLIAFEVCEHLLNVQSREGGELPRGCANAILNRFRGQLYDNFEDPEFLELKRQFEREQRRSPRP